MENTTNTAHKALKAYENEDNFRRIGFMAKRKSDGALFQYEWTIDNELLIGNTVVNKTEYEILEIFYSYG